MTTIFDQELIGIEYHKMELLRILEMFCGDLKDVGFQTKIRSFYRGTFDNVSTTKAIVSKEYKKEISDEDAELMTKWIMARLRKKTQRNSIPDSVKIELKNRQNSKCNICGADLGDSLADIHVDHIIPWVLVGDELENNYQDLCKDCNLKKNKQIDYMYKKLVKLV